MSENKTPKSQARKAFDKADKNTEWAIIKLKNLPDDCPVLVVTEFMTKGLAEFHLSENVIVPKDAVEVIQLDLKSREKKK